MCLFYSGSNRILPRGQERADAGGGRGYSMGSIQTKVAVYPTAKFLDYRQQPRWFSEYLAAVHSTLDVHCKMCTLLNKWFDLVRIAMSSGLFQLPIMFCNNDHRNVASFYVIRIAVFFFILVVFMKLLLTHKVLNKIHNHENISAFSPENLKYQNIKLLISLRIRLRK